MSFTIFVCTFVQSYFSHRSKRMCYHHGVMIFHRRVYVARAWNPKFKYARGAAALSSRIYAVAFCGALSPRCILRGSKKKKIKIRKEKGHSTRSTKLPSTRGTERITEREIGAWLTLTIAKQRDPRDRGQHGWSAIQLQHDSVVAEFFLPRVLISSSNHQTSLSQ